MLEVTDKYLEKEVLWFRNNLKELLKKHRDKWAVIHNETLIGCYASLSEAHENGVEKVGSDIIFIKKVQENEEGPRQASINITLGLTERGARD